MAKVQNSGSRRLRLFIAHSTPNSVRAEHNLKVALTELETTGPAVELEIIDIFSEPHKALANDVIVAPTLIGIDPRGRTTMVGDLADSAELHGFLEAVSTSLG